MHTSNWEVRAQNARRDPHPVCFRHRCVRVRPHCHRVAQIVRHGLRPACRRANDSQIFRDRARPRSMDESLQAKTKPTKAHAQLKWIHPAAVRVQRQHRLLQTHQEPRLQE